MTRCPESQFISLSGHGHIHLCVFGQHAERLHDFFFAMDQKSSRYAHPVMPGEQFIAIGVRGKAVDGVDACADRNFLAKQMDGFRAIDDLAREHAYGREADEDHAGVLPPRIVLQMVAYPPARGQIWQRLRRRSIPHDDGKYWVRYRTDGKRSAA